MQYFTDFSPTFSYLGLKPIFDLILPPGINAGVSQNQTVSLAWNYGIPANNGLQPHTFSIQRQEIWNAAIRLLSK